MSECYLLGRQGRALKGGCMNERAMGFCPACGSNRFIVLDAGACAYECVYCGKGIFCSYCLSGEMDLGSIPTKDWGEAVRLRIAYDKMNPPINGKKKPNKNKKK